VKHVALVREVVLKRVGYLLKDLRIHIGAVAPDETDVLRLAATEDLQINLSNYLLCQLGLVTSTPKDPRYDKTRRALAKRRGRPPRGLKAAGEPTAADALSTHEAPQEGP
jgi:hypothetical protein